MAALLACPLIAVVTAEAVAMPLTGATALALSVTGQATLAKPPEPTAPGTKAASGNASAANRTAASLPIPQREESWQVIVLSGQRVGYARVLTEPRTEAGEPLLHTVAETHLTIKRFGQTLRMKTELVSNESLNGDLRDFRFEMANPPAASTRAIGRVAGTELQLTNEVNGVAKTSTQPWKTGIKSPLFQDRVLRGAPLRPGETKTFEAFMPEMAKAATITVKAGDREETSLLDGTKTTLQKLRVSVSLLPGIVTTAWVDEQGQSVKSSTSMLGTEMVTYTVNKATAMESIAVNELDLGISTLVKAPVIDKPYQTKKVIYRVTLRDDDPSVVIPTGSAQQLKSLGPEVAELTVTAVPVPQGTVRDANPPAGLLAASAYVQVDDPQVQEHAKAGAGGLTDPGAIAVALEKYVFEKLAKKNFSTALASAGEVARSLEGDCTEHAVLLTALLRANKIPARAVVGMVYINPPSAFGGHMWTEAWLGGTWVPLDATLARGGIGATHIKLADVSFADDGVAPLSSFSSLLTTLGKLTLEVVSVE